MQQATGFVIHQSKCSSINGKGYDFFITRSGIVIPAAAAVDLGGHLHICIEGDFAADDGLADPDTEAQLFVAAKLIARLSEALGIPENALYPHREGCPGARFPWRKLVLSISDGYH